MTVPGALNRLMARASAHDLESFVSRVQLVGRTSGLIKKLPTFDRSRHVAPDAVNTATSSFLARLCESELAAEAETYYQRTRTSLQYKRKDLALDVTAPMAVLTARDFVFEIAYALDERAPAEYVVTRTLHQVSEPELVRRPEFDALFAGLFAEVGFVLRKGVQVEAVIDAVEALDETSGLCVDYPSDCQTCTLTVDGVEAAVICDGASVAMRFVRGGSPRELLEAFARVRSAFALSRQAALGGLLG